MTSTYYLVNKENQKISLNIAYSDFLRSIQSTLTYNNIFWRVYVKLFHKRWNIIPDNYLWGFNHKRWNSIFPITHENDEYWFTTPKKLKIVISRLNRAKNLQKYFSFIDGKWKPMNNNDINDIEKYIRFCKLGI